MKRALPGLGVVLIGAVATWAWIASLPPRSSFQLAYVCEASGTPQVHALLPDGGEEVWTTPPHSHHPSAAFKGGLLFIESDGEADAHLERLLWRQADGGVVEVHPENKRVRSPFPAGDQVLLESGLDGFSDIFLANLDGSALQLTHDGELGSFQPELSHGNVVYVSSRNGDPDLCERPLDGGTTRRLTEHPGEDVAPRVSPDGKTVAFVSTRGGTDSIFLLNREDLGVKPLHATPLDPGPKAKAVREDIEREQLWTKDGREVVFAARSKGGHLRIWAVEAATGKARALTDGKQDDDQPALSPDGTWIAFARGEAGQSQIWVVPLKGGKPEQLTHGAGARWLPRWLR